MENILSDKLENMPDNLIIDEFVCNNNHIAVLNNDLLKIPDRLILAKIENQNEFYNLISLTKNEYDEAQKTYYEIKNLFEGDL